MKRLTRRIALALLFAGLGAGCSKKDDTSEPAAQTPQPAAAPATQASTSASNLPGSQEVMAALDKKDYDGAIAALLRVRQTVTKAEQQVQFSTLADEVRVKLLDAGPSEPKVAEALTALRQITGGR